MLCICDPSFLPVQYPAVTFFLGTGLQCKCITTTVGLREAVGTKLGREGGRARRGGGVREVEREERGEGE